MGRKSRGGSVRRGDRLTPVDDPQASFEHRDGTKHERHEDDHAHLEVDCSKRDQHRHHEDEVDRVLTEVLVHHVIVDVSLHD